MSFVVSGTLAALLPHPLGDRAGRVQGVRALDQGVQEIMVDMGGMVDMGVMVDMGGLNGLMNSKLGMLHLSNKIIIYFIRF